MQRQLAEHERRDEQPAHAAGQPFGVRDGAHVGQQDRELVATEPRDDVVVPQRAAQPFRDLLQQLVPAVVAERVVDVLEPVDVQEHEPDAGPGLLRLEDRAPHPLREHAPVGQPRERVQEREARVLEGRGLQAAGRRPHGPEQHHPEGEQADGHDERQRADGLGQRGARGGVVEHHLGGADHVVSSRAGSGVDHVVGLHRHVDVEDVPLGAALVAGVGAADVRDHARARLAAGGDEVEPVAVGEPGARSPVEL